MFKKIIILFLSFLSWEIYAGDCVTNAFSLFQCFTNEQEENRSCNLVESAVIPFNQMVYPCCKDFVEDLSKEEREKERNACCNCTEENNLVFCSCMTNLALVPLLIKTGSWVVLPPYLLLTSYAIAQDCKNIEQKYLENKNSIPVITSKTVVVSDEKY